MEKPVILITGGSRGIGAATALLAAQRGYDVCFSYQSQVAAAADITNQLQSLGAKALAVRANFSYEADILTLFNLIDQNFGRLDALVNNVGVLRQKRITEVQAEELQQLFSVNVVASFLCAREAIKRMATSHGGRGGAIVNVSSIAALIGSPFEYIDYAATKGALDTFTLGLAKEVAEESIRVNAVRPGITNTDIHASGGEPDRIARVAPRIPMKRAGDPQEVAEAILWLLSDSASYVTGSILNVGGGI
jgi:NAD(P)-dependent dehydrogenase (short-subunit alcohol dehydrogenase family)